MFSVIMLRIATGVSSEEGETALLEPSAGGIQLSRIASGDRGDQKVANGRRCSLRHVLLH